MGCICATYEYNEIGNKPQSKQGMQPGDKDHDDVIKWKHFPRYWPFVQGIHRSPVNSLHKGQWRGALMLSLICVLNKQLSKQSWRWWFEMTPRSLWRHCNAAAIQQHHQATMNTLLSNTISVWYHKASLGYNELSHIIYFVSELIAQLLIANLQLKTRLSVFYQM